MSPILGIWASQISGHLWAPQGAYDALATVTVPSGGVASITFSGIPTGYKHLEIRAIGKSASTNTNGDLTFNGDTGNNYTWHYLLGDGSSASAGAATSRANIVGMVLMPDSSNTSVYSANVVSILDYASTNKYKTVRALQGYDVNGGGAIFLSSGEWMSTNPITSITFTGRGQNFAQYTQVALYGIK